MDQFPQHMKISELSAYSRIPVTTIRFYIHLGILPPPLKTAKTMAYYTEVHLKRLSEIQKLKEKNFSLSTIKDIWADRDNEQPVYDEDNGVLMTSTREEISRVAVNLFREKGYDHVTIADIAAAARIGKGTFYQYFRNKEELFAECLESIFYDIGKDIPELQMERDGFQRLFIRGRHFNRYEANILEMLNLARYQAFINPGQFKEKWDQAIANFIEPIRRDLELIIRERQSPLTNSTLVAYLFMGAVEYSYYCALNNGIDPEKLEEPFWKLFFDSVPPPMKKEDR
ncbi:TetR family transcriptional regulator [bacterium]|nr:TetR family transcriptional regulator [bacterium]